MAVDLQTLQAQDDAYAKQSAAPEQGEQPNKAPPSLVDVGTQDRGHVTSSVIDSVMDEVGKWGTAAQHVGRDVMAGAATAAANTMDAIKFIGSPDDPKDPANAPTPVWDHAHEAITDFRDAMVVQDPTGVDPLIQAGAQLAIPFAAYSKSLNALHGISNVVAAGVATDTTALAPHDMRTADLIRLGRSTDTKIGAALRAIGPYGLNAYVDYLADRTNETEAQGRFKNALDGLGANLILTPLIHAAGIVVKQGTTAAQYAVQNGIRNTISDLAAAGPVAGSPKAQRGAVGADLATTSEAPLKPEDKTVSKQSAEDIKPLDATVSETPPRTAALPSAPGELHTLDRAAEHTTALANVRSTLAEVHTTGEDKPAAKVFANLAKSIDQTASPENLHFKKVFEQLKAADTGNLTTATAGTHKTMGNVFGSYDPDAHTIAVHSAALQGDDSLLMHTLAHEGTHAATMRALDNPANAFLRRGVANLMQDAEKTNAVQALSAQDRYAFKEGKPAEFVAEAMGNPRLNAALKTEGLWPEVEDYIRRLLAPAAGAAVAAGITDADWKDPEFRKFFTDILTPREVPRA